MISYAGVTLTLDVQKVHEWLASTYGTWEAFFADAPGPVAEAFTWIQRRGIKAPEIGKLYWPNGASRWAVGCFLCRGDQLTQIANETNLSPDARTLIIEDGIKSGVTAQMHMLPPVLLNRNSLADALYVLVLVDSRFYWRLTDCSSWEIGDTIEGGDGEDREDISVVPDPSEDGERNPEWGDLIDGVIEPALAELNGSESFTISYPEIDETYLRCDIESLGRVNVTDNNTARTAANLLDAVAMNIGAEVVVDYNGAVNLVSYDDSSRFNIGAYTRLSGGNTYDFQDLSQNVTPHTVRVNFRKVAVDGTAWGTFYSHDEQAGGNVGVKVITDTAKAICEEADSEEPDNQEALDDLAASIASDWYRRNRYYFDITLQGICPVTPSSVADVIEFTYRGYPAMCSTRVRSRPTNQDFDRLNHQDPEAPFLVDTPKPIPVKLTEHCYMPQDGTSTAQKCDLDGVPLDPVEEIEISLTDKVPLVFAGIYFDDDVLWVVPWRKEDDELVYRPVHNGYQSAQAKADGDITAGGSGTVSVYRGTSDAGINVTAQTSQTVADSIPSGAYVDIEWRSAGDGEGNWEITGYFFECP